MGKRKHKRANTKIRYTGTGESVGGSCGDNRVLSPVSLRFLSQFVLTFFFSVVPVSRSLEQARVGFVEWVTPSDIFGGAFQNLICLYEVPI